MNTAGVVVVALGLILVIVALRGTQSQVFPFFFSSSASTPYQGSLPPSGGTPTNPDKNGNCPPGDILIAGMCVTIDPYQP